MSARSAFGPFQIDPERGVLLRDGQALGAGYLLEGSVRRSGDRLRLTAQLVDGKADVTLWANRFDGNLAEVFDFQDHIAESLATLVAPAVEATELAQSRQRLAALLTIVPEVRVSRILSAQPARYADRFGPIAAGLRRAGFPE